MRRLAFLLAIVLCASPLLATPNPYRLLKSVTALQTDGRNMCSVTSINNEKKYYLTAAHCVLAQFPDAEQGPNENMSIDGKPAFLVDVNGEKDLAVLMAPGTNRPALKLAKKSVRYLDEVYVTGHPFGWKDATVFRGWVSHPSTQFTDDPRDYPFTKRYMILQVSGAPGNSGSSVVNENMEVVSVIQISWGRSFEPVMGSAPYHELVRFASKYFAK